MSSNEIKTVKDQRKMLELDDLVGSFGRTFRFPRWRSGFQGEITAEGVKVELKQFQELQENLTDYADHPIVHRINALMTELELIEVKPDYNEFKVLFEKRISNLEKPKIVFMLGAGASKPKPSNIPTINEMLGVIVSKLTPSENPMTNKIREWSSRGDITIEDIMTAGYLSSHLVGDVTLNNLVGEIIYRTPTQREARRRIPELRDIGYVVSFKDLVDRIFSTISGIMIKADSNAVHESIAKLIKNCRHDFDFKILTTNYDICIEKALMKQKLKPTYPGIEEGDGVSIVKIHGSVNWFYCEGCQDLIIFNIKELEKFDKVYPTTASCLKCNTLTEQFLVPPIAYKYVTYPPIIEIWQSAMSVLKEADVIIVVGYSFSLADDYILRMIIRGLKKKSSLFVFQTKSPSSVNNLKRRLLAYHESVNLSLVEDADVAVPIICKIIEDFSPKARKESKKPAVQVE